MAAASAAVRLEAGAGAGAAPGPARRAPRLRGAAASYSATFSGQCATSSSRSRSSSARQETRRSAHHPAVPRQLHLVLALLSRHVTCRRPARGPGPHEEGLQAVDVNRRTAAHLARQGEGVGVGARAGTAGSAYRCRRRQTAPWSAATPCRPPRTQCRRRVLPRLPLRLRRREQLPHLSRGVRHIFHKYAKFAKSRARAHIYEGKSIFCRLFPLPGRNGPVERRTAVERFPLCPFLLERLGSPKPGRPGPKL